MRYLLLLIFCNISLLAQMPTYKLICESISDEKYLSTVLEKNVGTEKLNCAQALQILQKEGYWLAQCEERDSILILSPKAQMQLGEIEIEETSFLEELDLKGVNRKVPLSQANLEFNLSDILKNFDDLGYPFAYIEFRDYELKDNRLNATMLVNPGPEISLDSLVILGYNKIAKGLIKYEIGYRKGMPYSDQRLQKIEKNILSLPYLNAKRAPAVAFFKKNSILYLYLEKANNNQVTGIVGLNTDSEGRSTLNGDFQLALQNTFNRGEDIGIRWRRPDESAEDFKLNFGYPFLFNSPIGLSTQLSIFRQDSSFVNRKFKGQASYWLAHSSYFLAALEFTSSSALSNTESSSFGNLNDFNATRFKLGIDLSTLNNRLVASSGYRLLALALSADRQSDGATVRQYGWEIEAENYWNFSGNWVYFAGLLSGALFSDELFDNELFRLGGIKTLRGFNELSLFSSAYGIVQNEMRYMLGKRDYLSLFSDLAYTEKKEGAAINANWHLGLGTGINFQTKAGIFSLFLAVGKSNRDNFDFRNTKVHLSYINTF